MALRIDPKNDEFGMMENAYRGVRPAIGDTSSGTPEKTPGVEPPAGATPAADLVESREVPPTPAPSVSVDQVTDVATTASSSTSQDTVRPPTS